MSIMITGANGTVGADLARKLSRNYKIFGVYRNKNEEIKRKRVKWRPEASKGTRNEK